MLLRFFRSTGAQIIVFVPFLGILLWLPSFLNHGQLQILSGDDSLMPFYAFIVKWLPKQAFLLTFLSLAMVVIQAFWLVRFNTRFILINNRTYMPALFFVLLTALIPDIQKINPALISCFFFLMALEKIFDSYRNNNLAKEYFVASFYIALGSMFYPILSIFIIVIWVGLAVLRPFYWREWLFTILGFGTFFLFIVSYYYLMYNDAFILLNSYKAFLSDGAKHWRPSPSNWIILSYFSVIILFASQFVLSTFQSQKILPRKAFTVFFWLFLLVVGCYIIIPQVSLEIIYIGSIPISFLLTQYFTNAKATRWANILLLLAVLLAFIGRWF